MLVTTSRYNLRSATRKTVEMSEEDAPQSPISMSEQQLTEILKTVQQMQADFSQQLLQTVINERSTTNAPKTGNLTKCTASFSGSKDADVEAFLDAVIVYKDCCNVPDDVALRGLSLLLTGDAATYWQGIKAGITTWDSAVQSLRNV